MIWFSFVQDGAKLKIPSENFLLSAILKAANFKHWKVEDGTKVEIPSEIKSPLLQFICEICNIATTDQDGLDMHLFGKQHKKMSQKFDAKPRC